MVRLLSEILLVQETDEDLSLSLSLLTQSHIERARAQGVCIRKFFFAIVTC